MQQPAPVSPPVSSRSSVARQLHLRPRLQHSSPAAAAGPGTVGPGGSSATWAATSGSSAQPEAACLAERTSGKDAQRPGKDHKAPRTRLRADNQHADTMPQPAMAPASAGPHRRAAIQRQPGRKRKAACQHAEQQCTGPGKRCGAGQTPAAAAVGTPSTEASGQPVQPSSGSIRRSSRAVKRHDKPWFERTL